MFAETSLQSYAEEAAKSCREVIVHNHGGTDSLVDWDCAFWTGITIW